MKVILFDGVCNLCNDAVDFAIRYDSRKQFKFASQQGEFGQKWLSQQSQLANLSTIVLLDNGRIYAESEAVLRIAAQLSGWPRLLQVFLVVPAFIRDPIYRWIARNRYRWFGKKETCRLPTPEERERFLS